ncbi:MAG: hypothetical protein QW234_02765, partial [Nitrososphaerota archaeon]
MTSSLELLERKRSQILEEDYILRALFNGSSLTRRQLEALLLEAEDYSIGRRRTFEEKAKLMGITRGSYAKILGQALRNITQSLHALLLLGYMG